MQTSRASKLACLELEGREGVGRASEQRRGVELLLESIAEAAPRLAVQYQPPLRGLTLAGRSYGAESAEGAWRTRGARQEAARGSAASAAAICSARLGSAALLGGGLSPTGQTGRHVGRPRKRLRHGGAGQVG